MTSGALIKEISEVLRQGDAEFIEKIANLVLVPKITHIGGRIFLHEIED